MSCLLLGLNIDHIATLRNARGTKYPDPIYAAFIAEQAGVDSITVHLREDRRHITDRDVILLREVLQVNMNLEMAVTNEMIAMACKLKPHYCCLVPEKRYEITTEGGLDVIKNVDKLYDVVSKLTDLGIRVSLFIDPDEKQIAAAYNTGAPCIELHTGVYANSKTIFDQISECNRIKASAKCAADYGLKVHAGHGLNYDNVRYIAMIPLIRELNIGHSIIGRSIFCGLRTAIIDMKKILKQSRA